MSSDRTLGNTFERIFTAALAVASGCVLIYLAVKGPLVLHQITYRTAEFIDNQLVAQDAVNMALLSPLLIVGGILLLLRKRMAAFVLLVTPLYLIYYVLSYTIGWEWSSPTYSGNNEMYTFHFLFVLIAAFIILLYSLSIFPRNVESTFKKKGLALYSALFVLFLCIFASMWTQEILEVLATGTTRGYDLAPTSFWVIRIFDLGFSIPLGFISVYLLWMRPTTTFPIQFMFYGFFLTMIIAVNAMGFMMYARNDPTFVFRDLIVFLVLAVIIGVGFVYVLRHYKVKE